MLFEEFKKIFCDIMKNDKSWNLMTEEEKGRMIKYTFENQELIADVLDQFIKEKELN